MSVTDWKQEIEKLADAFRWRKLIKLCGYLGDGSQERVIFYQDDATSTSHITVGKKTYGFDVKDLETVFDSIPEPEE